jgi:hypothetical protein
MELVDRRRVVAGSVIQSVTRVRLQAKAVRAWDVDSFEAAVAGSAQATGTDVLEEGGLHARPDRVGKAFPTAAGRVVSGAL